MMKSVSRISSKLCRENVTTYLKISFSEYLITPYKNCFQIQDDFMSYKLKTLFRLKINLRLFL